MTSDQYEAIADIITEARDEAVEMAVLFAERYHSQPTRNARTHIRLSVVAARLRETDEFDLIEGNALEGGRIRFEAPDGITRLLKPLSALVEPSAGEQLLPGMEQAGIGGQAVIAYKQRDWTVDLYEGICRERTTDDGSVFEIVGEMRLVWEATEAASFDQTEHDEWGDDQQAGEDGSEL